MGEEDLPKGTGLMMGYFGLTYTFEKLSIHKIVGEAFGFNQASIKFHKKLGFSQEGILMKHILKNGHYEDIISFATFKEDWTNNKLRLKEFLNI